jgi:hypothetical protein
MSQVNDSSLRCDRYTGTVKIWLTKIDNIENIEIYCGIRHLNFPINNYEETKIFQTTITLAKANLHR